MSKLIITPKTKIYDLLDAYPELEEVLIDLVPTFKKLKNPVLRRTIARITTLQQAAKVGEISIEKIINSFRKVVGQDALSGFGAEESGSSETPSWFNAGSIVKTLNAIPVINSGGHPMEMVMRETKDYKQGEILELIAPFYPAPLIDAMKNKGFESWDLKIDDEEFRIYFCRKPA